MTRIACHPDPFHFHEITTHFLSLNQAERSLHFGRTMDDSAIIDYVERIMTHPEDVFVATEGRPDVVGVAHLEFKTGYASLNISVARAARGRGIGTLLLEQAWRVTCIRGANTLFVRGLGENAALRRIALKVGMQVAFATGEHSVRIELPVSDGKVSRRRWMDRTVTLADWCLLAKWRQSGTLSPLEIIDPLESIALEPVVTC